MKSHQSSDPQPLSLIRRLAVAALLGIGLFYTIRAVTPDAVATSPASAAGQLSTPVPATHAAASTDAVNTSPSVRLVTKSIEDIQLGHRVVGTNPLREQTQPASDIDARTWRAVRLTMTQHGVDYDLAFLRPLHWIETTGAAVGRSIHMELHEMGLDGQAKVVAIDPCPEIEPDDGTGRNVVTGTMAHPGANILYLDITGLNEPLGVTDTHPIWSETRQDFVVASQLQVGEQFRTLTGESATLTKIHPHRGPPEMVFNLEVDGEHVYSVAGSGLLVHNTCPYAAASRLGIDDLDNIAISNGVARVHIGEASTLAGADIAAVKRFLKDRGASSAVVESGLLRSDGLAAFLQRRVDDGRSIWGATVTRSNYGLSQFRILFNEL